MMLGRLIPITNPWFDLSIGSLKNFHQFLSVGLIGVIGGSNHLNFLSVFWFCIKKSQATVHLSIEWNLIPRHIKTTAMGTKN